MNQKLASIYKKIEADRKKVLDLVSSLSEEKFYHTKDNKWSVSQIFAHLIQAEELSLLYIKKKIQGIENAGNTNLVHDLKYLMLKTSQRLPLKYKAPKVLGEHAPPSLTLKEIHNHWDKVRLDLKQLLASIHEDQLKRKIYKHAVAGRLNILHAVDFFNEHLHHHLPQIKRLMK